MTNWPHAPQHRLSEAGAYMVSCGTHNKEQLLNTPNKMNLVQGQLFSCATEFGWDLQAWAILSNHYHFIASSPDDPTTLRKMISKMHTLSARDLNLVDGKPGRKVWFQYFESHITFINSYFAQLKYVHHNPTHHQIVQRSENYPWCSAAWFAQNVRPAFRKTVEGFKTDAIRVTGEYEPMVVDGVA